MFVKHLTHNQKNVKSLTVKQYRKYAFKFTFVLYNINNMYIIQYICIIKCSSELIWTLWFSNLQTQRIYSQTIRMYSYGTILLKSLNLIQNV